MGCEARWIGWSIFLLGGASLAFTGFDGVPLLDILMRLGIAALTGFVLSWIFCPARRGRARNGADGSGAGDDGAMPGEGCGDGGGEGGE